jgi:hypothetical protein
MLVILLVLSAILIAINSKNVSNISGGDGSSGIGQRPSLRDIDEYPILDDQGGILYDPEDIIQPNNNGNNLVGIGPINAQRLADEQIDRNQLVDEQIDRNQLVDDDDEWRLITDQIAEYDRRRRLIADQIGIQLAAHNRRPITNNDIEQDINIINNIHDYLIYDGYDSETNPLLQEVNELIRDIPNIRTVIDINGIVPGGIVYNFHMRAIEMYYTFLEYHNDDDGDESRYAAELGYYN